MAGVPWEDLARDLGQGDSVDLLIGDVVTELTGRFYELMAVAGLGSALSE